MATVKAYTARAHREGKWWDVHVPEIDKTTQVRSLDQVDEHVRDLIGLFTKDNATSVEVRRGSSVAAEASDNNLAVTVLSASVLFSPCTSTDA